jgi:Na+-translocating ferredoxin:NAD+ oxidoreductase RnfD subunit
MSTLGKRIDRIRQQPKKRQPNVLKTPKGYVLLILSILMVIAGVYTKDTSAFVHVGLAVVTAIILEIIFGVWQQHKRIYPDGAVITGLIVALVLGSTVPWYLVMFTTIVAIASKHLVKIKKRLIFNPAAFGLLVSSVLFSTEQSWWGSLSILPVFFVVILLIGGYLVTKRVHKFIQVFVFLGVYFLLLFLMGAFHIGNASDALRVPYINTALFLAFFMLTDPPTSPAKDADQMWFGVITAIVSVAIYAVFGGLIFLLIGLLVANAWTAWGKSRKQVEKRPTVPKTPSNHVYRESVIKQSN